jgi:cytochrome c oxidase subunit IV
MTSTPSQQEPIQPLPVAGYVWVWLALMVLLGLTLASSYIRLDGFNTAVNFVIAGMKAGLVAYFFMRLRSGDALVRIAAVIGVLWAFTLTALTLVDVLTRRP